MDSYYREYEFSLSSILSFVWRGIVVGCVSGIVVSLFRLLIGFISAKVVNYYELSHEQPSLLILILGMTLFIVVAIGFLIKSDSDIKGSGIPHVEGELKGLLHPDWWSVLWKKFVGGVLAISMGFMLGREGPSIQLGAMAGKGVACNVHYKPLPMMTAYKNMGFDIKDYPNAYKRFENEITLPLHTKLTDEEVEYVIEMFCGIVKEYIK